LLLYIPFVGPILVGVFYFLALAAGFVMTLVALGTAGGLNLMYPTIAVEGSGIDKKGPTATSQGSSSTLTVTLKAGTYTFYCPVDGHKAAGMKGTLTVK